MKSEILHVSLPSFLHLHLLTVNSISWCIMKLTRNTQLQQSLRFLLDHPRRCFILLFPAAQTYLLLIVVAGLKYVLPPDSASFPLDLIALFEPAYSIGCAFRPSALECRLLRQFLLVCEWRSVFFREKVFGPLA